MKDPLDDRDDRADRDDQECGDEDREVGGRPGDDQAEAEDDQPDLAGHQADGGHPGAGGEAETFGLGTRVATIMRHPGQPTRGCDRIRPGEDATPGDPEVDDRLAPAVEHRVHERAERADLASPGRAAIEHVEDPADEHDEAADQPELGGQQRRTDHGDPEADERQPVGRQAHRPIAARSARRPA